jgi:hypothetical protein
VECVGGLSMGRVFGCGGVRTTDVDVGCFALLGWACPGRVRVMVFSGGRDARPTFGGVAGRDLEDGDGEASGGEVAHLG